MTNTINIDFTAERTQNGMRITNLDANKLVVVEDGIVTGGWGFTAYGAELVAKAAARHLDMCAGDRVEVDMKIDPRNIR